MADEEMARVKVTRDIPIISTDKDGKRIEGQTTYYRQGWEGPAPRSHVDQIVNSGAGERVGEEAPARPQPPAGAAAQPQPAKPAA